MADGILIARKNPDNVHADVFDSIAALQHEQGFHPTAGQVGANKRKMAVRKSEATDRIALEGVNAKGDDDYVRAKLPDAAKREFKCPLPLRPVGAIWERYVEVEPFSAAGTSFIRIAGKKRIIIAGIGVKADNLNVIARVEYLLCAVSMVIVDVENCHPRSASVKQALCGDGSIVDETVAAIEIGSGVVAGGTAKGKTSLLALDDQICRSKGTVMRSLDGFPGAFNKACTGIDRI